MSEHSIGVVVSDSTIEITIAVESVTANSRKRRPTMPPMRRMGMNTAISESVIERTVKPISLAQVKAASRGVIPCSRYRVIFSITTMASSITKPVEIVSAISERLSSEYPSRYITAKVPRRDTGTAIPGMIVARQSRRKTNTTTITRKIEIASVRSTSWRDARIVVVRSRMSVIRSLAGIDACSAGIIPMIVSAVATMFEPGSLKTWSVTDGSPFVNPPARTFSFSSVMSAISPRRIAEPFLVLTMRSRYSAAFASWSLTVM